MDRNTDCRTCGHSIGCHEAGECWSLIDGSGQTVYLGPDKCRCSWYEATA